jgi:hypothetical protein
VDRRTHDDRQQSSVISDVEPSACNLLSNKHAAPIASDRVAWLVGPYVRSRPGRSRHRERRQTTSVPLAPLTWPIQIYVCLNQALQ